MVIQAEINKLYVDVDETLVFWDDPSYPYVGEYIINDELVQVIHKVLDQDIYEVIVWSGGGKAWAEEIRELLFPNYQLQCFAKFSHWKKELPEGVLAIDNRRQEERDYLQKFSKVFSPKEFIKEYK